jgi:hypothetical protein
METGQKVQKVTDGIHPAFICMKSFIYLSETSVETSYISIRGPFEKFVDSLYHSKSGLCGGAVTVCFSKYFPWQAMHFLQRSTHFFKRAADRLPQASGG